MQADSVVVVTRHTLLFNSKLVVLKYYKAQISGTNELQISSHSSLQSQLTRMWLHIFDIRIQIRIWT